MRQDSLSEAKKEFVLSNGTEHRHIAAQTFTFRELAAATNGFRADCLLGEGGFGRVYKGYLESINQVKRFLRFISCTMFIQKLPLGGLCGALVNCLLVNVSHSMNPRPGLGCGFRNRSNRKWGLSRFQGLCLLILG